MSKFVKELITTDIRRRLDGVEDALLVEMTGMKNDANVALRQRLRSKKIHLMMVKNSLARRAAEGTKLAPAFDNLQGAVALVWGSEDLVSLAKEVIAITETKQFSTLAPRGGVMDGQALAASQVKEVSKWPSRTEQLSILMGQILSPGATLSAQLVGPGRKLASQVKKKSEGSEEEASPVAASE